MPNLRLKSRTACRPEVLRKKQGVKQLTKIRFLSADPQAELDVSDQSVAQIRFPILGNFSVFRKRFGNSRGASLDLLILIFIHT